MARTRITNNLGQPLGGSNSIFRSIDLDESEEEVKGSAGALYSIFAMNMSAVVLYLKIYDAPAASVIVGTTIPALTFPILTGGGTDGAGFVHNSLDGYDFPNGITVACTTGIADNDTGAPGANECVVNIGYE